MSIFNLPRLLAYQPTSESIFTNIGTSSFTVPSDVYTISAVAIGGGGGGGGALAGNGGTGGGGGALAYGTFAVIPNTTITVVVGGGAGSP